jgi:membrane-associated phospholipid phosphatase
MTGACFYKESFFVWLSEKGKVFSLFGVLFYWALLRHYQAIRAEHLIVGMLTLILFWGGEKLKRWRVLLLPLLLTGMVYDSQRLYSDLLRGRIHVSEPYQFDHFFFGIRSGSEILTPNEWWQAHTHPILDFLCGFAYLIFIPEFFLVVFYFLFFLGKNEARLARQMSWGFFWLNVLGYSTYYWYAAAPPWYVAEHGFGLVDFSVRASLGGCIRFDQILGLPIFKTWYGHSADVFGAIPSLHVAYPFLALIYALRAKRLRIWSLFFFLWVSFSAVYLNHHYILDILWGVSYALLVGLLGVFFSFFKNKHARDRNSKPSRDHRFFSF